MFDLVFESLFKFFQFGADDKIAIGLIAIAFVVVLVVIFSCKKVFEGLNGCYNRTRKSPTRVQLLFEEFSPFLLVLVVVKNNTAVLRTHIIALPVQGGWVMGLPENFQQLINRYPGAVKLHLQNFCMTGGFFADLLVSGIVNMSATVSAGHFDNPFNLLEDGLSAPETTIAQGDGFTFHICVFSWFG